MANSPTIDRAQVEHVARLASLSLTQDEADRFTKELGAIVGYVEELMTLDTTDVPPTTHGQLERMVLRSDDVRPGLTQGAALAQAPRQSDGGFAVPSFLEG